MRSLTPTDWSHLLSLQNVWATKGSSLQQEEGLCTELNAAVTLVGRRAMKSALPGVLSQLQINLYTNTSCWNKEDSTQWDTSLWFHISCEMSYVCVSTTNIIWHDINWRYILKTETLSGSQFSPIYVGCSLFKLILTL